MKTLYFAYGSNMNSKQMSERCPDSKKIGIGFMENTTICFPSFYEGWEGGVAGYKRSQGRKLWGVIYEMSQADVSKLRVFEDYEPGREIHLNSYIEVLVDVQSNNETLQCMTYEVRVTGNYRPSLRYLKTIMSGAEENDLPEEYLEELSQLL